MRVAKLAAIIEAVDEYAARTLKRGNAIEFRRLHPFQRRQNRGSSRTIVTRGIIYYNKPFFFGDSTVEAAYSLSLYFSAHHWRSFSLPRKADGDVSISMCATALLNKCKNVCGVRKRPYVVSDRL